MGGWVGRRKGRTWDVPAALPAGVRRSLKDVDRINLPFGESAPNESDGGCLPGYTGNTGYEGRKRDGVGMNAADDVPCCHATHIQYAFKISRSPLLHRIDLAPGDVANQITAALYTYVNVAARPR